MKVFLILGAMVFLIDLFVFRIQGRNQVTSLPSDSDRWALLVGIGKYDVKALSELYGPGDVKDLASDLEKYAHFPKDQIIVLSDEATDPDKKPTRQNIMWWLSNVKSNSSPQSLLLFAFSGHGVLVKEKTYLLAQDSHLSSDPDYLEGGAISSDYIAESLRHSMAKQVILLLDACRTQAVAKGESAQIPLTQGFVDSFDLAKQNLGKEAYLTFYATHVGQEAFQNDAEKRSYFSLVLHKAFQGEQFAQGTKPYNDDGVMTLANLIDYVSERTPKLVKIDHPDKNQVPFVKEEGYLNSQVAFAERPESRLIKASKGPIPPIVSNKDADLLSQAFLLRATDPIKALNNFTKQSTATAKASYGKNRWLSDLWSLILAARLREMPLKLNVDSVASLNGPLITGDGRYLIGCGRQGGPHVEVLSLKRLPDDKTKDLSFPISEPDFTSCLVSESEGFGFATVAVKVTEQVYRSYLFDLSKQTPRLARSFEECFSTFDGKTLITVSRRSVTWIDPAGSLTQSADLPKLRHAVNLRPIPLHSSYPGNVSPPYFHLGPSVDANCFETCEVFVSKPMELLKKVWTETSTDGPHNVSLTEMSLPPDRVFQREGQRKLLDSVSISETPLATRQLESGDAIIITKGGKVFEWSTAFLQNCCEINHSALNFINSLAVGAKSTLAMEGTTVEGEKITLFREKVEKSSQDSSLKPYSKLSISRAGNWLICRIEDHRVLLFAAAQFGKAGPVEVRCDTPIETDAEDRMLACVDPDSGKVVIRQMNNLQNSKVLDIAYHPSALSFVGEKLYALTVHADSELVTVARTDERESKLDGQCNATVADLYQATLTLTPTEHLIIVRPPDRIELRSASSCGLEKTLAVQNSIRNTLALGSDVLCFKSPFFPGVLSRQPSLSVVNLLYQVIPLPSVSSVLPTFDQFEVTLSGLPDLDQFAVSEDDRSVFITSRTHVYQIPITESGLLKLAAAVLRVPDSSK